MEQKQPVKTQRPVYRITEKSFLPDERLGVSRIYDPEDANWPREQIDPDDPESETRPKPMLISYDGEPGPNLQPWNDAAKAVWMKRYGKPYGEMQFADPIRDLSIVGPIGVNAMKELEMATKPH